MRRLTTILILTIVFTGCGWAWKNIPGRAAELTPAQQIEQLTQSYLDLKFKYGAEMQISAQLKAQNMALQKKLEEANAKVAKMEMKPEGGKKDE